MIEGCHRRCIDKQYSSHLLRSLFNVKQENKLCDTTIYARDGQLRAHGVVLLASGCQAFMSLALDTDAVHHHVHCFGGEKMSSVLLFLELLYTGCVKFDDIQRARVLHRLCRDYGMKRALPEMESAIKILEEEEEKRKNMKDSQKKQETGLHILQDQQVLTNKELGIMKELGHPDIPKTVSNLSDPPHSVLHTMTSNSTSLLQSFQSAMQNALLQKSYLNVSSQPLSKTEGQNLIHTQTERSTQQHLLYVQNAAVSHCQQPSILQHSQQYSTNGRNLLLRQHETIQYSQPQQHSSMTSALLPQQHSIDRQPQVQQHLGQQQHLTRRANLIPQCDNITQTSQHALRNQEPWQHRQTDFTQQHDQHPSTVRELMQPSTTSNKLLHVSHNMQEGSVTFAGHCDLGLQGCAENVRTDIVSRHSLIPFSRGFQSFAHDFERKETSEPVSSTDLEEVQQLSNTQMDMETSLFLYQSQQSGCKQVIQDNLCHMQNAVTSESKSQSAVTSESMSQNAVTSASMSQSAVTSESMSQSAVTSESMSQSAVTSESMSQSTVTSESLSQSAVTSESMPQSAVTSDSLPQSAVTSEIMPQSAVTSDSLPQSAVTSESMSLSAVTFMNVSQNAITCKSMPQNIFTSDRSLQKVVRKQTTEVLRPNSDILICKDSVDGNMYDVSLTEKGRNRSSPLKTLPSFTCPEDVSISETDNGANNPTNCDEKISFLKNDSCCENSEIKRLETMPCPASLQKSYEDLSTQSAKGFNRGKRKKDKFSDLCVSRSAFEEDKSDLEKKPVTKETNKSGNEESGTNSGSLVDEKSLRRNSRRRCVVQKTRTCTKAKKVNSVGRRAKDRNASKTQPSKNIKWKVKDRYVLNGRKSKDDRNKFKARQKRKTSANLVDADHIARTDNFNSEISPKKSRSKKSKSYSERGVGGCEEKKPKLYKRKTSVCYLCSEAFRNVENLKEHYRASHPSVVKCRKCEECMEIEHLNKHYRDHHIVCDSCGYQPKLMKENETKLAEHKLKVHEELYDIKRFPILACEESGCRYRTVINCNLQQHRRMVHLPRQHVCEECGHACANSSNLRIHKEAVHNKEERQYIFQCQLCEKRFQTKGYLKNHMAFHNKQLLCHMCSKCCSTRQDLAVHLYTQHSIVSPNLRLYQCEYCDYKLYSSTAFKSHVASKHGSSKDFKCTECGKAFYAWKNLRDHMRIHQGIKYTCPMEGCTFSTVYKSALYRRHIPTVHTEKDIKNSMCHLCDYQCKNNHTLKTHLRVKHQVNLTGKEIKLLQASLQPSTQNQPPVVMDINLQTHTVPMVTQTENLSSAPLIQDLGVLVN